jgi:PPOX class probable F420-dependent enzyme
MPTRARTRNSARPILTRALRKFLRQPRTARLATISPDGYPHIVPIWFMLDGDDLVFASDDNERKVKNARANPKGAVVIGGEPDADNAGYLIRGDLSIQEKDIDRIRRALARRYGEDNPDWAESAGVVIRLTPKSVVRVW